MRIKISIVPNEPYINAEIRLDMKVDPKGFSPFIKKSIQKMIDLSESRFMSLDYIINSNLDGIQISSTDGKTTIETNLPRDEALNLIKNCREGILVFAELLMPS